MLCDAWIGQTVGDHDWFSTVQDLRRERVFSVDHAAEVPGVVGLGEPRPHPEGLVGVVPHEDCASIHSDQLRERMGYRGGDVIKFVVRMVDP